MLRKFSLGVVATLVLAGSIFGFQASASAGITDDPDHWAHDAAKFVRDECVDIPTTLMGSASGVVAPLGLTQQGPEGLSRAGAPPTTITVRDLAPGAWDDEFYRKKMDAQQLRMWLENGKYGTDPTVEKPRLPISTVGGSNSAVIETTGTVKTGTDNTKAVVTPARVAGTGLAAISGSTVSLSALVFGGSLCGTVNALGAVFGDPWADSATGVITPGVTQPFNTSGLVRCSSLTGSFLFQANDACTQFVVPTTGIASNMQVREVQSNGGNTNAVARVRDSGGTLQYGITTAAGGATATLITPCIDLDNMCGLQPLRPPGTDGTSGAISPGSYIGLVASPNWPGLGVIDLERQSNGYQRRLRAEVGCKRPSDGHTMSMVSYSAPFWDRQATPDWPATQCNVGYAPTSVLLQRQTKTGGGATASSWGAPLATSLDWALPPSVVSNATTLACFVRGATTCARHDLSPGDPAGNEQIGGPGGITTAKTVPSSDTVVQEVIDGLDLTDDPDDHTAPSTDPDPDPDPDPGPGDTESPDPCSGGVPSGECGTPPGEDDPVPGESCMPAGWGWFNPIEWVLKPIKCALIWAFWDQDAADEISELTTETGWPDLVGDSSFDTSTATGPCIPIDEAEICTQPILEIEAPEYVQVLIAALVSFFVVFEVVGLFSRITQT